MVSAPFVFLIGRLLPDNLGGLTNKEHRDRSSLGSLFIMENFMNIETLADVVNLNSLRRHDHTASDEDRRHIIQ